MPSNRFAGTGLLLAIVAGLLAIAWAIYSHGANHQRFQITGGGMLLDTVTGEVLVCNYPQLPVGTDAYGSSDEPYDCRIFIRAQR